MIKFGRNYTIKYQPNDYDSIALALINKWRNGTYQTETQAIAKLQSLIAEEIHYQNLRGHNEGLQSRRNRK